MISPVAVSAATEESSNLVQLATPSSKGSSSSRKRIVPEEAEWHLMPKAKPSGVLSHYMFSLGSQAQVTQGGDFKHPQ